jgi:archaellum component FlaC
MKKKNLTNEEKEDIRIVIETTHRILSIYEHLNAARSLNEEEQHMMDEIRETLEDVLAFSGMMIEQIHVLRFENAIDQLFNCRQKSREDTSEGQVSCEDVRKTLVDYLKTTTDQKLN